MVTEEKEKLPVVVDDFGFAVKGGILHVSLYSRLSPYGSTGMHDEERVCINRVAFGPEMLKGLIDGLQKAEKVMRTGKLEVVN